MMYKHILTARLYIIVSCWVGGMLLSSYSPNQDTSPVEGTSAFSEKNTPDSSEETIWRKLSLIDGDGPQSYTEVIDHFAQALNTNGGQSVIDFTRNIHRIAEQHKWEHDGFRLTIEKCSEDETMKLRMHGKPSTQPGYLDKPYSEGNGHYFNPYLEEGTNKKQGAAVFRTPFNSNETNPKYRSKSPGRILAIPMKKCPTVYHFSKKATDEQIIKFWSATINSLKSFGPEKLLEISIHTGSNYKQSIAHFHLRFKIKEEYHLDLVDAYKSSIPDHPKDIAALKKSCP